MHANYCAANVTVQWTDTVVCLFVQQLHCYSLLLSSPQVFMCKHIIQFKYIKIKNYIKSCWINLSFFSGNKNRKKNTIQHGTGLKPLAVLTTHWNERVKKANGKHIWKQVRRIAQSIMGWKTQILERTCPQKKRQVGVIWGSGKGNRFFKHPVNHDCCGGEGGRQWQWEYRWTSK